MTEAKFPPRDGQQLFAFPGAQGRSGASATVILTMAEYKGQRYLLFRLLLIIGGLLGVLLLAQSVRNYRYVSERLVEEELFREAARHVSYIHERVREAEVADPAALCEVLEQVCQERKSEIAWLRVVDGEGKTLGESGRSYGEPFTPARTRAMIESGQRIAEVRTTPAGKVLVTLRPFRYRFGVPRRPDRRSATASLGQAPGRPAPSPAGPGGTRGGPGARMPVIEVALYWNSAVTSFGALRRNLIISLSAALALLASMAFIGLRFRHYIRGKQLEQQLELARSVQEDLLPPTAPVMGSLELAAECQPAWQVGGDFYDVFEAGDGRVAMLLGDVSGKGLPAALLMGLIHGAVRSSHWVGEEPDHEDASRRLNELLLLRTSVERFASMFWCYYDSDEQVLRYVNAGHLPPYLVLHQGNGAPVLRRLEEGGPVLGVIPDAEYKQGKVHFRPGDLLVLYSDGVVEAANATEEEFGEERLAAILRENHSRPAAAVRDEILCQVKTFIGNESPQDDLTLLIVKAGALVEESETPDQFAAQVA